MNRTAALAVTRSLAVATASAMLLLALTTASARTIYIIAEPQRPQPRDAIVVRLMVGGPFVGNEIPFDAGSGARLERLWNSGRESLGGSDLSGPPAVTRIAEAGVQLLAYEPSKRSVDPAGQRRDAFGKALVVVGTAPVGQRVWRSELGHRLEIVPGTDPVQIANGGGVLEVQILFDREPLIGAVVAAVPAQAPGPGYRRAMTDVLGRVRFDLDRPGAWMVHVVHKHPVPGRDPAWEILEASLVLVAGPEDRATAAISPGAASPSSALGRPWSPSGSP